MNKITRYTLLLSLSCLTSVPTRAEVVSSGDKLLEIISNNQTGSHRFHRTRKQHYSAAKR